MHDILKCTDNGRDETQILLQGKRMHETSVTQITVHCPDRVVTTTTGVQHSTKIVK